MTKSCVYPRVVVWLVFFLCSKLALGASADLRELAALGFSVPVKQEAKTTHNVRKSANRSYHDFSIESGGDLWKVEVIRPLKKKRFDILADKKRRVITSLYENSVTPYPGEVTNLTICGKAHKPMEIAAKIDGQQWPVVIASASERNSFGACSESTATKNGTFVAVYNQSQQSAAFIRIFEPREMFNLAKTKSLLEKIKFTQ